MLQTGEQDARTAVFHDHLGVVRAVAFGELREGLADEGQGEPKFAGLGDDLGEVRQMHGRELVQQQINGVIARFGQTIEETVEEVGVEQRHEREAAPGLGRRDGQEDGVRLVAQAV